MGDGRRVVTCHGAYRVRIRVKDDWGQEREVEHTFYDIGHKGSFARYLWNIFYEGGTGQDWFCNIQMALGGGGVVEEPATLKICTPPDKVDDGATEKVDHQRQWWTYTYPPSAGDVS